MNAKWFCNANVKIIRVDVNLIIASQFTLIAICTACGLGSKGRRQKKIFIEQFVHTAKP